MIFICYTLSHPSWIAKDPSGKISLLDCWAQSPIDSLCSALTCMLLWLNGHAILPTSFHFYFCGAGRFDSHSLHHFIVLFRFDCLCVHTFCIHFPSQDAHILNQLASHHFKSQLHRAHHGSARSSHWTKSQFSEVNVSGEIPTSTWLPICILWNHFGNKNNSWSGVYWLKLKCFRSDCGSLLMINHWTDSAKFDSIHRQDWWSSFPHMCSLYQWCVMNFLVTWPVGPRPLP